MLGETGCVILSCLSKSVENFLIWQLSVFLLVVYYVKSNQILGVSMTSIND